MGRIVRVVALGVVVAGLLALLTWFPWAPETLFERELRNLGHFPLFAAIGAALYALVRAAVGERVGPAARLGIAAVAAVVLALGSEIAQYYGPRDAAFDDLARDVAGAGFALAWIGAAGALGASRPVLAFLLRAAAVVALLVSAIPTVAQLDAERRRDERFPVLLGFETAGELRFVLTRAAAIDRVPAPAAWERTGLVGRARFAATDYPQITLREPVPDWRGFERLCVDVWVEDAGGTTLVLALNDAGWDGGPRDRKRVRIELEPGAATVCLDLSDPHTIAGDRAIRLDAIRSISLFAVEPERPFEMWLDDLRLEMPDLPVRNEPAR